MEASEGFIIKMEKVEKVIKKWEKGFEHKMSSDERTMFIWGILMQSRSLLKQYSKEVKN